MTNLWTALPSWLRKVSIGGAFAGVILLADFINAVPALEPFMPAHRGFVTVSVKVAGDDTNSALNVVRSKLLKQEIKDGVKYRLDLSIQELELRDKLAAIALNDPERMKLNELLAAVLAGIEVSKTDDRNAQCELGRINGTNAGCMQP